MFYESVFISKWLDEGGIKKVYNMTILFDDGA
jgi:hypothetical protein